MSSLTVRQFVGALRGSGVWRAGVQMVAVGIDVEVFALAFVVLELLQVRDWRFRQL